LFVADRVDEIVDSWPSACGRCGSSLERVPVGLGSVHQVAELPPVAVRVTEYRLQRVCCAECQATTVAELPEGVTRSAFGPRLHAVAATLTTQLSGSRRKVAEIINSVFGCPLSIGAVDAMLERVGDALEAPYGALLEAIHGADCVNADETSWRMCGSWHWVWGAFTAQIAVLMIDPARTKTAAKRLLGEHPAGVISSDRHGAYNDFSNRQLCWAHLDRNLSALAETGEPATAIALAFKADVGEVFAAWSRYRDHHQDRARLANELDPVHTRMQTILGGAASLPRHRKYKHVARVCRSLAKSCDLYWTFVAHPGVEPTNNHAERGLRHAVIYRKISGGSRTQRGAVTSERLLTAHQTCRLQHRSLFGYLADLMTSTARGQPAPTLLPS